MTSLWEQTWEHTNFAPLEGDRNTDVLIIGGGMTGVLCAYWLHHAGVPYILAEAETVCSGITKNTTAKLTSQHGLIYDKLIGTLGMERAKGYLSANQEALQKYRLLCRNIDCDFEEKSAYVYALHDRRKLEQELTALEKLGFQGEFTEHLPLPFSTAGAVKFSNQAQFHPLKFISAISKGLHIYERTPVRELIGATAVTDRGKITARNIIVATHFPFLNKHGSYFIKLYQRRSYVIALEHAANVDGMYIDEAEDGLSFRNYGDLLLIGGGGRPPHWKTRRRMAGAAGLCRAVLPQRHREVPLGHPGLHEPGWRPLYRPLFRRHVQSLCGHRLQQMGHDLLHGLRHDFKRPRPGEEKSLCGCVFPFPLHSSSSTGCQRPGGHGQPADPYL